MAAPAYPMLASPTSIKAALYNILLGVLSPVCRNSVRAATKGLTIEYFFLLPHPSREDASR